MKSPGQVAYEAYAEAVHAPMTQELIERGLLTSWEKLPEILQTSWSKAATAVLDEVAKADDDGGPR